MPSLSPEFIALQKALAGEYSLDRELGRGGMGIVYLARDVQLDRYVAIKVLPGQFAARPEFRERFLREARTAAGLSHPNIVPIHRVGEAGGFVFFVMSYVPGETLGERLRTRGPLPPADAMRILREVAWALAYAHGRSIVHRDVKPDNILLEDGTGRALVTDFGIARVASGAQHDSDPGRIMGTVHFMSPEQASNEPVDGRSDLYALGVVGYLAVSGRLPFDAPSVPALLVRQVSEPAPSLRLTAPGVPAPLADAIDRCLLRDPRERFASGEAVADALAPRMDVARPLPMPLRAWLRAQNPGQFLYYGVFSLAGMMGVSVILQGITRGRLHFLDMMVSAIVGAAPLVPMVGFHLNQGRRLFRLGYSLGDIRTALAADGVAEAEREDFVEAEPLSVAQRVLRVVTYGWLGATLFAVTSIHSGPMMWRIASQAAGVIGSMVLVSANNAASVPLLPRALSRSRGGLRAMIWNSRIGQWLATKLGAPAMSRPVGDAIFRKTEAALSVAAAELFAALPRELKEDLSELPSIVALLEARAAEARARIDELDALPSAVDANEHTARREQARRVLGESVAALETIRLDLLRLLSGASDLAPLTTLLDAARALGDEVSRLAIAQRHAVESANARVQDRY